MLAGADGFGLEVFLCWPSPPGVETTVMAHIKRKAFEAGHQPKLLVIIDGKPESSRSIRYAARRASRTGASLMMLAVTGESDFNHWLGVGDVMRSEAAEQAGQHLARAMASVQALTAVEIETLVVEGVMSEQILVLIHRDEDISSLILAAGTDAEGPGPLVSLLAGKAAGHFPIPIVIVPGHLDDQAIDALS